MSQRNKRLNKKLVTLSENYEREADLCELIDAYTKVLEELNKEMNARWNEDNNIMGYVYKKDDANISYNILTMPNGGNINVIILETENEIAVAYDGLIGKAKKHEQDVFNFETGYNIAAARLMMKILQREYKF